MGLDQNENAFKKQGAIFVGAKSRVLAKRKGRKARFYKDVGLGFKTPKAAIEVRHTSRPRLKKNV